MPNQPRDGVRPRSIKVHDDLWRRAQARATERGESLSEAIRQFLERYAPDLDRTSPPLDTRKPWPWDVDTEP